MNGIFHPSLLFVRSTLQILTVAVFPLGISSKKEENNLINGKDADLCVSVARPQRSPEKSTITSALPPQLHKSVCPEQKVQPSVL